MIPDDIPTKWKKAVAAKTLGDGNCLYNAISYSKVGDNRLASPLRSLAALELWLHTEDYVEHPHFGCLYGSDMNDKIIAFIAVHSTDIAPVFSTLVIGSKTSSWKVKMSHKTSVRVGFSVF